MKTVLVTRRVPAPGLSLLRARGFRVAVSAKDRPMSRTELLRAVKNADGLLSQLESGKVVRGLAKRNIARLTLPQDFLTLPATSSLLKAQEAVR
jgi:hypothetical protein